jgi:hypothetical protein
MFSLTIKIGAFHDFHVRPVFKPTCDFKLPLSSAFAHLSECAVYFCHTDVCTYDATALTLWCSHTAEMILVYQLGNIVQWIHSNASSHCALPVHNDDCNYEFSSQPLKIWLRQSSAATLHKRVQVHAGIAQRQFIMMSASKSDVLSVKKWFGKVSVATFHRRLIVMHIDTSHWQFIMANMNRLDVCSQLSLRNSFRHISLATLNNQLT